MMAKGQLVTVFVNQQSTHLMSWGVMHFKGDLPIADYLREQSRTVLLILESPWRLEERP